MLELIFITLLRDANPDTISTFDFEIFNFFATSWITAVLDTKAISFMHTFVNHRNFAKIEK